MFSYKLVPQISFFFVETFLILFIKNLAFILLFKILIFKAPPFQSSKYSPFRFDKLWWSKLLNFSSRLKINRCKIFLGSISLYSFGARDAKNPRMCTVLAQTSSLHVDSRLLRRELETIILFVCLCNIVMFRWGLRLKACTAF